MDVESVLQAFLETILSDWPDFLHGVWVTIELTVLSTWSSAPGTWLRAPPGISWRKGW